MSEEEKTEKSFSFVDKRKLTDDQPEDAGHKEERAPAPDKANAKGTPESAARKTQEQSQQQPLPEVDFNFFILSLSSSAMMQMGVIPNPVTQEKEKNMDVAKQTIDIIAMLKKKTEGNLTSEEEQFIEAILYDLRMKFVEESKSG